MGAKLTTPTANHPDNEINATETRALVTDHRGGKPPGAQKKSFSLDKLGRLPPPTWATGALCALRKDLVGTVTFGMYNPLRTAAKMKTHRVW